MDQITCSACQGTGTVSRGTVVGPIDPSYDVTQHGGINVEWAREGLALLALVEVGDKIEYSGGFQCKVINVGMYDGWPFWRPTPAARTLDPLGVGDWHFFYDIRAVQKRGKGAWIRKAPGLPQADDAVARSVDRVTG